MKTKSATKLRRLFSQEDAERKLEPKKIKLLEPYKGMAYSYKFQCLSCNHEWTAQAVHIFYRRGCPNCAKARLKQRFKLSDSEIKKRLQSRGFYVVGPYTNFVSACKFQCPEGHVWETTASGVLHAGTGCPFCAGQRADIPKMLATLKSRNIRLIGDYTGALSRHSFECGSCRWSWQTTMDSVYRRGSGCPECSFISRGIRHRLPTAEVQARLKASNLELLDAYQGLTKKHQVRCVACGYVWLARAQDNHWHGLKCPECHPGLFGASENSMRKIIEDLTGVKFPKARPKWLQGRGRLPLELDGYNEKLKVAFEYQGGQHYFPIKWFGGLKTLLGVKLRDDRKRKTCDRYGVLLIRIPYFKKNPEAFIRSKLEHAGIPLSA